MHTKFYLQNLNKRDQLGQENQTAKDLKEIYCKFMNGIQFLWEMAL
jgi:hypothetical protein